MVIIDTCLTSAVSKGQKGDQSDSSYCSFSFMVQKKGQAITKVQKGGQSGVFWGVHDTEERLSYYQSL